MPAPTSNPAEPDAGVPVTAPCPCGREPSLDRCCLPIAQRLRTGTDPHLQPSPYDEIRASCALLLWSMLHQNVPSATVRRQLSAAARGFWGVALTATSAIDPFADAAYPGHRAPVELPSTHDLGDPDNLAGYAQENRYAMSLFERTWAALDSETRSWLLGSLPAVVRLDPAIGEMALDWLLWDGPWLRGAPAAGWLLESSSFLARTRIQRTGQAILRSSIGLWHLDEAIPQRGFMLHDRLSGARRLLHTASDPWPDADERLLLARLYRFGSWNLIGGRCLLLDQVAATEIVAALARRTSALDGPSATDPDWPTWLKAQMIPVAVNCWLGHRLALPTGPGII